jgi:ArsR family transcriptional regulator
MSVNAPGSIAPAVPDEATFKKAAQMFRVMSAPTRLKIINQLCEGEKNVGQLLEAVETTQPNMSQHLLTLFKAGILAKRREGVHMFYRIANEPVIALCRAICGEVAGGHAPPARRRPSKA